MTNLTNILNGNNVDIYDADTELALSVHAGGAKQVSAFIKDDNKRTHIPGVKTHAYDALLEASDSVANVCMLNNNAIKVLVAMYPSAPKYVLLRIALRTSWVLGFLGLIRRLIFGLVRIEGIAVLESQNGGKTYWLVLEQSGGAVHRIPVIPAKVGIQGFLHWLRERNINYVVLRFFNTLPALHREAGDLDILIADEDKEKVEHFLQENKDKCDGETDVRVGLHNVSGSSGMIPYYPPRLARQILANATDGAASSRIPSLQDALLSFIYHCLYHSKKGYASGIPSSLSKHTDTHPENDYLGEIQKMAGESGVKVGNTMEEMDEYMAAEGWRPQLDTLAKMAETNAWVRDRFFNTKNDKNTTPGLAVFILREWVLEDGLTNEVLQHIRDSGYHIVSSKELTKEEKRLALEQLRGGTWGANKDGDTKGWNPAYAIAVLDSKCAQMPISYAEGFERFRIRTLKEAMRKKFDRNELSSMHSTDNSVESWEYISVCFPDKEDEIRKQVAELSGKSFFGFFHTLSPKYIKHAAKHSLRGWLVRTFLE